MTTLVPVNEDGNYAALSLLPLPKPHPLLPRVLLPTRRPKPTHILASIGSRGARETRRERRREATPGACDRVQMLLPAKWCPHQVSPSRMEAGMRVVRIHIPKDKPKAQPKAQPKVQKPTATAAEKTRSKKRIATSPLVETRPSKRVVQAQSGAHARSATHVHSPTHIHSPSCVHSQAYGVLTTPFRNPDLNDRPPQQWRMFKEPGYDRRNWTWSDWDSPSQEFEDVTWQSADQPLVRDPFAHLPPALRERIQAVLGMKPDHHAPLTDVTADTVRYESAEFMSTISSREYAHFVKPMPAKEATRSRSPDSSWDIVDEKPWSSQLLEMRLDDWRINPLVERFVMPEHSPLSSHASSLDASTPSQRTASNTRDCSAKIPSAPSASAPSASAPSASAPSASAPSASALDASVHSQSSGPSSKAEVVQKQSVDCLKILQQAEEKLRERQAQRALTGKRDRLPSDSSESNSGSSFSSESLSAILRNLESGSQSGKRDRLPSDGPESNSSSSVSSESLSAILRNMEPGSHSGSDASTHSSSDLAATIRHPNSGPERNSGASTPSSHAKAKQHFHALSRPSSPAVEAPPTLIPQSHTAPIRLATPPPPPTTPQRFYTQRQLPSAEPRRPVEEQSRGAGFGWKSLACVAVGAAALGAGLAYAWFSG
ncbi:hypothetical protein GGR53DRAFT_469643 [Hypoxylon sp. FL1150]|nr:hypothetical protein GGR53DRAFT_469643 [Hypoxylon sp. FL1150]